MDFTIIIATFNSAKTLAMVLDSVRRQRYDLTKIEVILMDGYSTDSTRTIAQQFPFVRVIDNPKVDPVNAKFLGYKNASAKYLMYLDHDEVLENLDSLQKKYDCFESDARIVGISTSGYRNPPKYPFLNQYINDYGDPFSAYYYNLSKDYRYLETDLKQRYKPIAENEHFSTFQFSHTQSLPLIELVAGGACIRKSFVDHLNSTYADLPLLFQNIAEHRLYWSLIKDDPLTHYSSESFSKYKNKIKWRIRNNIFHKDDLGKSGFSGRERNDPVSLKMKKFLFLPYTLLIVPCLAHSVYLVVKRQNLNYFIHFPLSVYTGFWIATYYFAYFLGITMDKKSYDGKKNLSEAGK